MVDEGVLVSFHLLESTAQVGKYKHNHQPGHRQPQQGIPAILAQVIQAGNQKRQDEGEKHQNQPGLVPAGLKDDKGNAGHHPDINARKKEVFVFPECIIQGHHKKQISKDGQQSGRIKHIGAQSQKLIDVFGQIQLGIAPETLNKIDQTCLALGRVIGILQHEPVKLCAKLMAGGNTKEQRFYTVKNQIENKREEKTEILEERKSELKKLDKRIEEIKKFMRSNIP